MSDDYLWDGSGKPDPDVQRLEQLLERYRHTQPAPQFPLPVKPPRRWRVRFWVPALAAAAGLAIVAWTFLPGMPVLQPAWGVARLEGSPRIGAEAIRGTGSLGLGQWLETDQSSRARIDVGLIGEVRVEPNTRIGLLAAHANEHRLDLERGKIHARIWAPPGLFFVNTPSGVATDLGCAYTLEVNPSGAGSLRVTMGWVAFEYEGRESFVPEGAMCHTRRGHGPGTPYREDASPAFQQALEKLDFTLGAPAGGVSGGVKGGVSGGVAGGVSGGVAGGVSGGVAGGVEQRAETLGVVLKESRKEDALTLWHLLARTQGEERARVYARMAALVPPPASVTRDGILRGEHAMMDQWWNELGLKSASWWRLWKGPWPQKSVERK